MPALISGHKVSSCLDEQTLGYTQTHLHRADPYESLHAVLWSMGPDLCHRSVAEVLSLQFGHVQLGPNVIIAPGLPSAHCYVGGERGSASPEPAEWVTANKRLSVFLPVFFISFFCCLEAERIPAQQREMPGGQESEQATGAHLESHGVSCSQEDPQRQLGFVGAVAPQAMRTSCHTQSRHQETEIRWKTQKQNTECARGPTDIVCAFLAVKMLLALPGNTCRVTQENWLGRQEVRVSAHLCLTDSLPKEGRLIVQV